MTMDISVKSKGNSGLAIVNPPEFFPEDKTIVVMGPARSGTTMVAQILVTLGLYMGECDVNLYEDIPIRRAIRERNMKQFRKVVSERNKSYQTWGWKYPESVEVLEEIRKTVRNPFFIFTFRDPLATSLRNLISGNPDLDLLKTMQDALNYMTAMTSQIAQTKVPCLPVSYEKALSKPRKLVEKISEFLDFPIQEPHILDAVDQVNPTNNRYLMADQSKRYRGRLDGVNWNQAWGWAFDAEAKESLEVVLKINDKAIYTGKPERYRKGLHEMGFGDGKCGFQISIKEHLIPGHRNRIEAYIAKNSFPLFGSPQFLHPTS